MHPLVRFACRASAGIAAFGLFMYGVPGGELLTSIPDRLGSVGQSVSGSVDRVVDTLRTPGNGPAERAEQVLAEQQAQLCEVQVALGEPCTAAGE